MSEIFEIRSREVCLSLTVCLYVSGLLRLESVVIPYASIYDLVANQNIFQIDIA